MGENWMSLVGIAAIFAIAVLLSTNRRAIRLRVVATAFALQAAIAAFVLYVPAGRQFVQTASGSIQAVLDYASAGIAMMFGPLASMDNGLVFAIHVLPVVVFFASLTSVLYHVGVMSLIVNGVGRALKTIIGAAPLESLNAASNIFVGMTEAPLVIKPYLHAVTRPQLFTIMVSGMASVAGSVLAAYAQLGITLDYLLAASFMAAPGGLLMAKIIMPDEPHTGDKPEQDLIEIGKERERHANVIMAAAVGAQDGVRLAVNIAGMLIAFVSLIALANGLLGGIGGLAGVEDLTVQRILGFIFAPVMFLLSVPWSEAQVAGALFGEKLILNEFVAYLSLSGMQDTMSDRTVAVVTFALCGFANLSSIAILLGGLGTFIPDRMEQMAGFGLRAVAAASLANLMSAALAGLLVQV